MSANAEVTIVDIYDGSYWTIFAGGELIANPYKENFTDYIFRSSFRKEIAEKLGVATDDLRFTVYDFHNQLYKHLGEDYDGNDYMDWEATQNAIQQFKLKPEVSGYTLEQMEERY